MGNLTIGQLAKESGVRTDTIRYYEQLGLIHPEGRSEAGYRLYSEDSIRLVQFVRRSKDLGFKLAEIKTLLTLKASETATCQDMLERTDEKLDEARQNIKQLGLSLQVQHFLLNRCLLQKGHCYGRQLSAYRCS